MTKSEWPVSSYFYGRDRAKSTMKRLSASDVGSAFKWASQRLQISVTKLLERRISASERASQSCFKLF